ncbi:BAD_collapsed_G0014950.mRNA.1.CDS.1 [Saccharomyces cerevisiae]|nr:BAD_HP_G0037750.mRNA.1.CDS.1 [Saccharomyces cerevisiae]CAI4988851.1 BAD_HP_G0057360.mRNA.1.CDS.1 [Saccharomyces cerevisiae]CAI6690284.1 BAD_HP_G0037750.mRNA.1.CDS.1 [Saccharomyces cerevisiae]CAI6856292.1 BAD_HP_G0057360.mRNA.1.CDS.1 [Saccharomyces cerevisiae]CAI7259712.1 BAD_collapsed_G0014950.mRNA.1.CDS.1 [Saccharomyces cerevisiae]
MSSGSTIVSSDKSERTFKHEEELPKLPLPKLRDTLQRLKESLEPLYYADGYYQHPLDPEQIEKLSSIIRDFEENPVSEKLQSKLQSYHDTRDCYLDELHLDINNQTSTREIQDDVLPRNPFLVLADDALPNITQADRSAVLVHSAARFISALKQDLLPPDINATNGKPLSMAPFLNLFGTTRSPVFQRGEVENFDLNKPYTASDLEDPDYSSDEDDNDEPTQKDFDDRKRKHEEDIFIGNGITIKRHPDSKHILIISRGQYYTLEVLDSTNKIIYTAAELTTIFNHIIKDSSGIEKSTALGSLTSHSFRNWKYARKRLQKRYPNELHRIDSALFVLVLDESQEETTNDGDDTADISQMFNRTITERDKKCTSANCKRVFYGTSIINSKGHQVGSCVSRWYDKLQLVVTADAKATVIWDSFTCDGSVVLRFTSEIYTESVLRLARDVNAGDPQFSLWPNVTQMDPETKKLMTATISADGGGPSEIDPKLVVNKIDWSFSNILNTHVHLSETKLADLISKYDIVRASIPLGRRSAQRLGVKPDSMVQVALQIAHYALYGRMVFGLEPVSTRGFKNSRSSFINIQSQALLELCQLFISSSIDGTGKLDKFIQTCETHNNMVKHAKSGVGYEKHFNALKYLFKFHDHFGIHLSGDESSAAKDLFENPLVLPFSQPELIVANCGNAATTTFGITPAVPHGFGIGYIIKDDQVDLTVTSQFRQGDRLMFMLSWVLGEIRSYWRMSRGTSHNKTGVKISPVVDKLYEMDNAVNNPPKRNGHTVNGSRKTSSSSQVNLNRYGGFFDLEGHIDSRNISKTPSMKNLQKTFNGLTMSADNDHSSSAVSVPTEKEKLNTGHEILQIQPREVASNELQADDETDIEIVAGNADGTSSSASSATSVNSKKRNVINSRFDIDFDRSRVGRKVVTLDQ